MGGKEKPRFNKIMGSVLIILLLFITGIVIYHVRKADKRTAYLSENASYEIYLSKDGTFSLYALESSSIVDFAGTNAPNHYRWDGDMLTLEYSNTDAVLYFRKEGDTLVFKMEQSVLPKGPYGKLSDGLIFKRIRQ